MLPGGGLLGLTDPVPALPDDWALAGGALAPWNALAPPPPAFDWEALRKMFAPPGAAPEVAKLRELRDLVQELFLNWRRERVGWECLAEEILSDDESGTARWLYGVLTDLDEMIVRHEGAIVGLIEEGE